MLKRLLPVLLLLLCVPAVVHADDQARELFKKGVVAFDAKDYGTAEQHFRDAFAIRPASDIAANLGITELKLAKYRLAAEHLHYALGMLPVTATKGQRESIEQSLAAAKEQVATLRVAVDVAAMVSVAGQTKQLAAAEATALFVDAGEWPLEVTAPGRRPHREVLRLSAGSERDLEVVLPDGAASDGWPAREPLAIASTVGAGAALVVGVVGTVIANAAASDAAELDARVPVDPTFCSGPGALPPDCAALDDALSRKNTATGVAIGGYVGAGVLGVAAAVLWLLPGGDAATSEARVLPQLGPSHVGITFTTSF